MKVENIRVEEVYQEGFMSSVMPIVDVDSLDGLHHEVGLYVEIDPREVSQERLIEHDEHENEGEEDEFIEDEEDTKASVDYEEEEEEEDMEQEEEEEEEEDDSD